MLQPGMSRLFRHRWEREARGQGWWRVGLVVVLMSLFSSVARAGFLEVGAVGDSYTASYDGSRPSSLSWTDLLGNASVTGTDFGIHGGGMTHSSNWAAGGTTSSHALYVQLNNTYSTTTENNLSDQIAQHKVQAAVVATGFNDLTGTDPAGAVSGTVSNIESIINSIRSFDSSLPIVLANIPDASATPDYLGDTVVHGAIVSANQQLESFAEGLGIPVADWYGISRLGLSNLVVNADVTLKPTDTDTTIAGDADPTLDFWADGVHPTTIPQGLFAQTILDALLAASPALGQSPYDPQMTDYQILHSAGFDDTTANKGININTQQYVITPSPSSLWMLMLGAAGLMMLGRGRLPRDARR